MKVTEPSTVAQVAAQARSDPQTAEKPAARQTENPDVKPSGVNSEEVSISFRESDAVERHGAPQRDPIPEFNRDVRRNYSVEESGQVVVKVIDKQDNEVLREIPPEEQRRIKEAIAEINQNSVESRIKPAAEEIEQAAAETQGQPPNVDVTT